ncbi:MAG: PaaI family thioesterase, partial [Candidatus Rokuibacteriota bacterium]
LDPVFQGLPGVAHGGSVLAAFDAVAALGGTRRVAGLYRRRVPLGTPLGLEMDSAHGVTRCRLYDSTSLLVEGRIDPGELPDTSALYPAPGGSPLPVSSTCFVCGVENAAGLQARLWFDDVAVGGTWTPAERFRDANGGLSSVALLALVDEAAFWLGALATGESGMTTDLAVTLAARVAVHTTLTLNGARARVRPTTDDRRYWQTQVEARDDTGRLVAAADITFVAVRGAARKLASWVAPLNPPEVLHRIFPAYA